MLAATKVKISGGAKKKIEQEHTSLWKFLVVVVQNNGKEMYKKNVLHVAAKFLFFC